MPIVEVTEVIQQDIDSVWKRVCDVESYPHFMEPVLSVRKVEDSGSSFLVEWEVRLKGSILKWTEAEIHSPERHRIDFVQVDGDLEKFEGYWQLTELSKDCVEAVLYINFEIGIPMLRDMLDPVAEKALRENSRIMLRSLEAPVLSQS